MFQLSSHLGVNSVVWIHSLRATEKRFTDRAIDDLQPFLMSAKVHLQSFEPATAAEVAAVV
jgi:hypothetical protein